MKDCNLSKRMKTKDDGSLGDRISVLPIEILVSIVSLLPLENAGATSILSRPGKNVWKYTLNLNFVSVQVLVGNENLPPRPHQSEVLYSLSSRYVNCVNQVLDLHEAQSIQRFRANFYLDCRFTPFIDQWIHFAMEKGVQILELDFCHQWFSYAEPYTITKTLLSLGSKFEHESLNNPCTLNRGTCGFSAGFSTLKVLLLKSVGVTGEVLKSLLSKCPLLERLSQRAVEK